MKCLLILIRLLIFILVLAKYEINLKFKKIIFPLKFSFHS